MKVLNGLKDVIRGNRFAVQGSKLYAGLMLYSKKISKPKWQNKIEQRLKRR